MPQSTYLIVIFLPIVNVRQHSNVNKIIDINSCCEGSCQSVTYNNNVIISSMDKIYRSQAFRETLFSFPIPFVLLKNICSFSRECESMN